MTTWTGRDSMAKRTLCQADWCTQAARQVVSASDTSHQLLVCNDSVHERWAKMQIGQDFPGRAVEIDYLNNEADPCSLFTDRDSAVIFDDDVDGM